MRRWLLLRKRSERLCSLSYSPLTPRVQGLGTIKRCVRECDIVEDNQDALRVLDLILRVAAPEQIAKAPSTPEMLGTTNEGEVTMRVPEWIGKPISAASTPLSSRAPMAEMSAGTTTSSMWVKARACASQFFVLSREAPTERRMAPQSP